MAIMITTPGKFGARRNSTRRHRRTNSLEGTRWPAILPLCLYCSASSPALTLALALSWFFRRAMSAPSRRPAAGGRGNLTPARTPSGDWPKRDLTPGWLISCSTVPSHGTKTTSGTLSITEGQWLARSRIVWPTFSDPDLVRTAHPRHWPARRPGVTRRADSKSALGGGVLHCAALRGDLGNPSIAGPARLVGLGRGPGRRDRRLLACSVALLTRRCRHQLALHRSHRRSGGAPPLSRAAPGKRRAADGSVVGRHQHCRADTAAQ